MRRRLASSHMASPGSRLETSVSCGAMRGSVSLRSAALPGSSGPKRSAKAMCWAWVRRCPGKTNTAYCVKAAWIAAKSSSGNGPERSTSPTSATNAGVTG